MQAVRYELPAADNDGPDGQLHAAGAGGGTPHQLHPPHRRQLSHALRRSGRRSGPPLYQVQFVYNFVNIFYKKENLSGGRVYSLQIGPFIDFERCLGCYSETGLHIGMDGVILSAYGADTIAIDLSLSALIS